jgi:hypothetical protein
MYGNVNPVEYHSCGKLTTVITASGCTLKSKILKFKHRILKQHCMTESWQRESFAPGKQLLLAAAL